ncbi:hypothetical protein LTR48_002648 [Friedmanniomyces endolithicus]|uniref:AMP-binding enzyme C-terminal domain-containing protein n=1 Tax=Friedmanniomyces endolithicus TaxID=329885 RepID=A0A4U0TNV8_9PEZI|nr:hypothetical protein LTR48_002648 [Friedmanniomyces endolithicus]TKA23506.1 hypothetical protein B0A54_17988 [Friedmanniomyces endolithicus]
MKELIKWNGFQVAPAELEGLLFDLPLVHDVAVIGIPNEEEHTELPRAYIVPAEGQEPSHRLGQEIVAWLDERVAYYKKLRGGGKAEEESKNEKRKAKL